MTKLLESFDKIISFNTTRYGGCKIEKINGRYRTLGKSFSTLRAAKDYIDKAYINLEKSIKHA